MKRYSVILSAKAQADMESIYRYIADELLSPQNAMDLYNRIADAILSLDSFPERFHAVRLPQGNPSGIRQMQVGNYSVFYLVRQDDSKPAVAVLRVLYNGSEYWKKL